MNQLNKEQKHSQLNPVIYPDGIIRLNGRYKNSDLPDEMKLLIVVSRNILRSYWLPTFMKEIITLESHIRLHNFERNIGYHKDEQLSDR